MPTVIRAHGLRFAIYTDDHPPPHVHVEGHGGRAKILIETAEAVWDRDLPAKVMRLAKNEVRSHSSQLMRIWTDIHG